MVVPDSVALAVPLSPFPANLAPVLISQQFALECGTLPTNRIDPA